MKLLWKLKWQTEHLSDNKNYVMYREITKNGFLYKGPNRLYGTNDEKMLKNVQDWLFLK